LDIFVKFLNKEVVRGLSQEKRSVLIIDDDPSILRTVSRILTKAGYAVDKARTDKEASEQLSSKQYDVALIDVGLGATKGTDLLPLIHEVAPNLFKIIFTGTPLPESLIDNAKKGADVFLLKPVKPETLLKILEDNFARK